MKKNGFNSNKNIIELLLPLFVPVALESIPIAFSKDCKELEEK